VKVRDEFHQTGVYLLIGPRADGEGEMVYVGEGDPVKSRLESHFANKDFWTRAIFFVAGHGQLNKAHVQFLESQLVARARKVRRMVLDNGNVPADPSLSEADRADMEVFLSNMLGMLPLLGVVGFEAPAESASKGSPQIALTCRGKGVEARGYESTQGFVVKAGSEAVDQEVPSMQEHVRGMYEIRRELIGNGVLAPAERGFRFTQDYVFTSPSTAAAVVLGRSANGRVEWKDASGKTLKEIQEQQATR
jgi:hypothetical protein